MEVIRVEKHIIKQNNEFYNLIDNFCFMSKNLYNHANYIIRNNFTKDNKWIRYNDLDKILKVDENYPDYKNMPTAQSAQQILRLLDKNWIAFFRAIKDWNKHPNKYLGRPKLPKYKDKNSRQILILTGQNCKIKGKYIQFPKIFNGFKIQYKSANKDTFKSLQQVRFLPRNRQIVVEIVYKIDIQELKRDNSNYLSIDIGIDNLAAVVNNKGIMPFIINGKGLKSMNKYYNKLLSHYREIAKRMNKKDYTKRMNSITQKRNNKINDYMHKASRYIVDYANKNNINTIIIGNNKGWKQGLIMSKEVKQTFVGIATQRLIEYITYKAEEQGINVVLTEESYTSGTSFLDNELPIKENYNKTRRKYRGLFISNKGIRINADINGAYQIMKKIVLDKKVIPKADSNGIKGVGLHPVKVTV